MVVKNMIIIDPEAKSVNDNEEEDVVDGPTEKKRKTRRTQNRYIIDDQRYDVHATNQDGSETLHCVKRGCQGRGKLIDGVFFQKDEEGHTNCAPQKFAVEVEEFKKEFSARLQNNPKLPGKIVFDELANDTRKYPVAMALKYNAKWKKFSEREKIKMNPPQPTNLQEMYEALQTKKGKTMLQYQYDELAAMEVHIVENNNSDGSSSRSLIFIDTDFLRRSLKLVEPRTLEGFCDATFRIVPKKVKATQLLMFQVIRVNQAHVLFYSLMERKTTESYEAVFRHVFDTVIPEIKEKLGKVHMDFERAEANALKTVIAHIQIVPCLFHFCQAQWKNARKKGALIKKTRNGKKIELTEEQSKLAEEIEEVIRLIGKIPFLQQEDINEQLLECIIVGASNEAQAKLSKYLDYFRNHWLKLMKSQSWSVNDQAHRTNNFAESRNRDLNALGLRNPLPWAFIRAIMGVQKTVMREFETKCSPKSYDRLKEDRIQKLLCDYRNKQIPRMDLLLALMREDSKKDTLDMRNILNEIEEEEEDKEDQQNATESRRTTDQESEQENGQVGSRGNDAMRIGSGEMVSNVSDLQLYLMTFTGDD